jgi:hypothetical protein
MQITDYGNYSDLKRHRTALLRFGKLLGEQIAEDKHPEDFYCTLPPDLYHALLVLNALQSYCAIHHIATTLLSD